MSQKFQAKSNIWLISFSDLVCILLVFFILLFSMSHIKNKDLKSAFESFSASQDPISDQGKPNAAFNTQFKFEAQGHNLDYLESLLVQKLKNQPLLKDTQVKQTQNSLILSLPSSILFENNSDQISQAAEIYLSKISDILEKFDNKIELIGYTDEKIIHSGTFKSNWALALARAISVEKVLRKYGYVENIRVQAIANGQANQIPLDISDSQRQNLARKVDIIILETAS